MSYLFEFTIKYVFIPLDKNNLRGESSDPLPTRHPCSPLQN